MSTIDYIDSDDEIIYTEEMINNLCSEEKEDLLDIDKIILAREKKSRRKLYEHNIYKSLISDIEIGKNILEKYNLAISSETPIEMIYKDNNNEYFSIRDSLSKQEDILEQLRFFKKEHSISLNDFILAYYFSNRYKSDNYLIKNLNQLKKLTSTEYTKEEWEIRKNRLNTIFNNRMEITRLKYEKIKDFYDSINSIPFSTSPEKIQESFELKDTKIKVKIKKENYLFDIDSGAIIFEELKVTNDFPYLQYNSFEKKYYKIFENTHTEEVLKIKDNFLNNLEEEEREKENSIYMIYRLEFYNKIYYILLDFNLEESTLSFKYPYNTSQKIYKDLGKIIPGIRFKDEKILDVSGSFEIKIDNYKEINFYYLTLFDEKFSRFLFLKEEKRPRSLMKNIKYHYRNYNEISLKNDYKISFFLEKIYINRYLVDFRSKFEEKDSNINEFSLVLSKLINYYENYDFSNTDIPIIVNPYTGRDGNGLGDNLREDDLSTLKSVPKGKKLINLINDAPEIFPVSEYGRKCLCPNQPIRIDEEDLPEWSNYLNKEAISVFPPENSVDKGKRKYIFACPTDDLVFNYIVNPDSKSPFPILPCCSQTVKNDYYENYNEIKADKEKFFASREGKKSSVGKGILKKVSPLASNQKGNLPLVLSQLLKKIYPAKEFYRYGLNKNSKISFFHCCLYASDHLKNLVDVVEDKRYLKNITYLNSVISKYNSLSVGEKDILADKLRDKIIEGKNIKINIEIAAQELYEFDSYGIKYLLENEPLDSKYFYKLMEYLFFVNIFVFSFKDGNVKLEKPNHRQYHQREIREGLPCLLLIKHEDESYPIYEIIRTDEEKLFGETLLNFMKNYIQKHGYIIASFVDDDYVVTKNYYSNINWNIILKNYKIEGQFINQNGRTYALNLRYGGEKDEIVTIFISSSFPFDAPKAHKIYKCEKNIAWKLLGKDYTIGSEGFWYNLNNCMKKIFVPVIGVKNKKENICYPYVSSEKSLRGVTKFNQINIIKKNAKIIIQIILWIWNLSEEDDLDKWFSYYISKGDKQTINSVVNHKIIIDYRFPLEITTPEEAIEYYSDYIPSIFGKDVIFLYDDLEKAVYQYLKNYISSTSGYGKIKNKAIVNVLETNNDFTKRISNRLIIDEKNYDDWYTYLQNEKKDRVVLDSNLMDRKRGFLYKNRDGNVFVVQNNIQHNLDVCILTSKVWRRLKYNLSYEVTLTNIWKFIAKDYRLMEALDIHSDEIINLANSYSKYYGIEIEDLYNALEYLAKEKIEFTVKEGDRDYITINYLEYINKENLKSPDPYIIFSYEDEAFATMLNIG
jgi:hypothetical protein